MRLGNVVAASALAISIVGTAPPTAPKYQVLDSTGNPLRSAFNGDSGKVRVVMLVAPT